MTGKLVNVFVNFKVYIINVKEKWVVWHLWKTDRKIRKVLIIFSFCQFWKLVCLAAPLALEVLSKHSIFCLWRKNGWKLSPKLWQCNQNDTSMSLSPNFRHRKRPQNYSTSPNHNTEATWKPILRFIQVMKLSQKSL